MANSNIFIEKDVNNIFIINPNKVYNNFGTGEDRYVPLEELIYYVNLECEIKPRSRLIGGLDNTTTTTQIAYGKINFLKPKDQEYLTTKWSLLQTDVTDPNTINGELLGIKSVTYKVNTSFIPTITVTLEDSKGRALMESGDNSLYSSFFNLPYPTFYLTLKGYYGKAIRYPIILQKFNSTFNSSTGNFDITLNFIAYQFNVLTDITISSLMALPQMYVSRTTDNVSTTSANGQNAARSQVSPQTQTSNEVIKQKGMKKLREVYQKYKLKNLIDENVPEFTIQELITKLENFVNYSLEQFGQISLSPLNDVKEYSDTITAYRKRIYSGRGTSWYDTYLSKKNFFINNSQVNDELQIEPNEIKIYTFSDVKGSDKILEDSGEIDKRKLDAQKELIAEIENFNQKLLNNDTFGRNGKYEIPVNITLNSIGIKVPNYINAKKTYSIRYGVSDPTNEQITEINNEISTLSDINDAIGGLNYYYFDFDSPGQFNDLLNKIQDSLNDFSQKIEKELTDELAKFVSSSTGLGFVPSLKNIMGVILASAEAFLLLMDDVHEAAYKVRNNKKKQLSVGRNDVKGLPDSPVYPWPLYTKLKECNKYEIKYPGDNDVINETKAYDYEIWPEVEFIEEFLKGYMQRQVPPASPVPLENEDEVKRIMVSGFDTRPSNVPYSNLDEVSFFYEFYERILSIVEYNGFLRKKNTEPNYNAQLIFYLAESEATNILNSILTESPSLVSKFTNTPFQNSAEFIEYLRSISNNGTGVYWNNLDAGLFNTEYLKEKIIDKPSALLKQDIPTIKISLKTETNMTNYMSSSVHNNQTVFDLLPYTNETWRTQNLSNGESEFSFENSYNKTNSTLFYNTFTKKISNYKTPAGYGVNNDKDLVKPFTSFKSFYNVPSVSTIDFSTAEIDKKVNNYILTEGTWEISSGIQTSTSMLNTPYFINAIQEGVNNVRNGVSNPYKTAAYLFLNSLPLSTLREKYISYIQNEDVFLDFISPSLNKFSGIHGLPKLWICKIGSIYHRYKNYILNNVDILDNVWTKFDVLNNYYPTSNPTLDYLYVFSGQNEVGNVYEYKIRCSGFTSSILEVNVGFYPKVINDFFQLIYNQSIFSPTDSIAQITEKINKQIKLGNLKLFTPADSTTTNLKTWSVLIKSPSDDKYFIVPSFGLGKNELQGTSVNLTTQSEYLFDGTVRLLWGGTHYGYFTTKDIIKPTVKEHLKKVFSDSIKQEPFRFKVNSNYSSIEEIFGVFTKSELDEFEQEFLNFSNVRESEVGSINFQKIILNTISGEFKVTGTSDSIIVQDIQQKQLNSLTTYLPPLMNINTLLKRANVNNFNLPVFNYFRNNPQLAPIIQVANGYTGNLPPGKLGSPLTLEQSQQLFPNEWKTLQLEVGFSTINNVQYTDEGSYYLDFFKDFNFDFTVSNITQFSQIIKMYGTFKKNQNSSSDQSLNFRYQIGALFVNEDILFNEVFNNISLNLRKNLPQTDTTQVEQIDSIIQGFQSKVELYDMFKAVNDKWVSANDYKTKTLFEDFLFLDRANRDIGGEIFLDVNYVTKYLKNLSPKTNVFMILDSIFKTHNFVTFSMPAYINFYNNYIPSKNSTNKQEEPNTFANNLFGTFNSVDYQNTGAKLVSVYVEKPSNQLNNNSKNNGHKDDGLNLLNDGDTLRECDTSKQQDFAKSNKVVGFAVDFQLQNQSVFDSISVGQELGKATSESLTAEYNLANQSAGINSSNQNVSLYNIYKDRSYSCTVTSLGNAMIQPTMYFVLRNVPLFAGSYYITEVEHRIGEKEFKTTFTGTRQNRFTLPKVENTFQTLKTELLKTLNKNYQNKLSTTSSTAQNKNNIKSQITNAIKNADSVVGISTCSSSLFADYQGFIPITENMVAYSPLSVLESITGVTSTLTNSLQRYLTTYIIFKISSYIEDGKGNGYFSAVGFNFGDVTLDIPYTGELVSLLSDNYICVSQSDKTSKPYAVFPTAANCVLFVSNRYIEYFKNIFDVATTLPDFLDYYKNLDSEDKLAFKESIAQAWIEYYPYNKVKEYPDIFNDYKTNNPKEYQELLNKISF